MKQLLHLSRGWLIILACLYGCKWLVAQLQLPIPGAILAMLLLCGLLLTRVVKESWIKPAANPLLHWMGLFFVPAGVGVVDHLALLQSEGVAFLASAAISTLLILLFTGHLYQLWEGKGEQK